MEISPLIWAALITFALLFLTARRHGQLHRAWAYLQQRHAYHHACHPHHRHHAHWRRNGSPSRQHHGHHSAMLAWTRHSKLHQSGKSCKVDYQDKVERLVQHLELRLNPTPRQQKDWETLKLALAKEGVYLNDIGEKQQLGLKTQTTPARLELQATIKLMENESLQRLQAPLLRFYLMLDERQRYTFDHTFHWPSA